MLIADSWKSIYDYVSTWFVHFGVILKNEENKQTTTATKLYLPRDANTATAMMSKAKKP